MLTYKITFYFTISVPEIEVIDLDINPPQVPVAAAPPPPPPAVAAPQEPTAPARRGRRRRGQGADAATPARRGRRTTTEGERNEQSRPTRSSARHAFYGNGDSDDDFIMP